MTGYSPVQATPEFYVGQRVEYIAGPGYYQPLWVGRVGTVTGASDYTKVVSTDVKWDDNGKESSAYNVNLRAVHGPSRAGMGWIDEGLSRLKDSVDKAIKDATTEAVDVVALPQHYRNHPSGVECITITQHMNFCRGNAIKYLWRAGEKGGPDKELEDLRKAAQYIAIEIKRLENAKND